MQRQRIITEERLNINFNGLDFVLRSIERINCTIDRLEILWRSYRFDYDVVRCIVDVVEMVISY